MICLDLFSFVRQLDVVMTDVDVFPALSLSLVGYYFNCRLVVDVHRGRVQLPYGGLLSNSTRLIHRFSCSECDAFRYSASQVLRTIVFCLVLFHPIGEPNAVNSAPSCEWRSFADA